MGSALILTLLVVKFIELVYTLFPSILRKAPVFNIPIPLRVNGFITVIPPCKANPAFTRTITGPLPKLVLFRIVKIPSETVVVPLKSFAEAKVNACILVVRAPVPRDKVPEIVIEPKPVVTNDTFDPVTDCVRLKFPDVQLIVVLWEIKRGPPQLFFPLSLEREI
jgi:hypothetical protein